MTVILPRRSYSPLLGRLLHDHTADKIAREVSRIPRSAATIIPYDVQSRLEVLHERQAARAAGQTAGPSHPGRRPPGREPATRRRRVRCPPPRRPRASAADGAAAGGATPDGARAGSAGHAVRDKAVRDNGERGTTGGAGGRPGR